MSDYYSFSTEYSVDEFYRAVLMLDKQRVERLKAQGISLTENVKQTLVNGGGSMVSNKPAAPFWYLYITDLGYMKAEDFIYISRTFFEETGEPLYYSESLANAIEEYLYDSAVFICIMECYNLKKINKKKTLQNIILKNKIDLLKICVNAGWLSQAKKRDELIEYARMNNQVECTSWLMDFKNRTADFAAEREKSEKKMQRELNADPSSVGEMKKIWSFTKQEDGTLIITNYKGSATVVTIPGEIGKSVVTAIGEYAFSPDASRITSEQRNFKKTISKVTLPDSIRSIGESAFQGCWEMSELNIPDGVVEIGRNAFCSCRKVTEFVVPETVEKMGSGVFMGCIALRSVNLPKGITEISDYLFSNCPNLPEIKLPAAIQSIGIKAFAWCESFEEIVIPESVKSIGIFAFAHCKSLERVKLPHGITEIGENTFANCFMLKSIEIPDTVEEIGEYAFYDCDSFKRVELPNNVQNIGRYAFGHCGSLETVVLPSSIKQIKNWTHPGSKPETIFDESPNVTAIVEPKSYAERYCKRNEIPYKYAEK